MNLTPELLTAAALALVLGVALVVVLLTRWGSDTGSNPRFDQLADSADRLATAQAELAGRLSQMGESQVAAQAQINQMLEARLDVVSKRLGDGLVQHAEKTGQTMTALHERLVLIDAAQKNIAELSRQVVGLQDILSNKQARGAFGEVQLNDLVSSILPPSAYAFQVTMSNRSRADCLLRLPNPPGNIAIDAKFPLESYQALRNAADDATRAQAARAFGIDVTKHIRDIAEKYIVPGETADSALMFLPSEAVYAELHANFRGVVEDSFRRRVWIVSPTTLMATLNTVRAVLKDVHLREQAGVLQAEIVKLLDDVGRLDTRVQGLQRHFDQANEDIRQIRISTEKVARRGGRIDELQFGDDTHAEALIPPSGKLPASS